MIKYLYIKNIPVSFLAIKDVKLIAHNDETGFFIKFLLCKLNTA